MSGCNFPFNVVNLTTWYAFRAGSKSGSLTGQDGTRMDADFYGFQDYRPPKRQHTGPMGANFPQSDAFRHLSQEDTLCGQTCAYPAAAWAACNHKHPMNPRKSAFHPVAFAARAARSA
jgi:hypothetical protein